MDKAIRDGLIEAVRRVAKAEILPRFRNLDAGDIDTKTGPEDLVTIADRAAEAALAAEVERLMPGVLVVGEEATEADPELPTRLAGAPRAVILDPIDGTGNFTAGLAVFGVILAVMEAGEVVFGLLYDPVLDDWVMAEKGEGAWFCRPGVPPRKLAARKRDSRSGMRGFIPLHLCAQEDQPRIGAGFARFYRVDSLHCSCHEYRMMALGQADFMVSPVAKPWDHAAGSLIIAELGGRMESGSAPGYDPARPRTPILALVDSEIRLTAHDLI